MGNTKIKKTKKAIFIASIILVSSLGGGAQDTLTYKYICKIDTENDLFFLRNMILYYVSDSVFVMEGLFDSYTPDSLFSENDHGISLPKYYDRRYHFKIENDQWFMKYEDDWIIFFNGKEEQFGNWEIGRYSRPIQWEKTDILDGTDTVYTFRQMQPTLIIKEDGSMLRVVESDERTPYFFTFSSGIITLGAWEGEPFVRADKAYLRDLIVRYIFRKAYKPRNCD